MIQLCLAVVKSNPLQLFPNFERSRRSLKNILEKRDNTGDHHCRILQQSSLRFQRKILGLFKSKSLLRQVTKNDA